MSKFNDFVILPISLLGVELVTYVLLLFENYIFSGRFTDFFLSTVSIIMYYFIGSKLFVKVKDTTIKRKSIIFTSILIVASYIISIVLSYTITDVFLINLVLVSPVANLLTYWFPVDRVKYLYEIVITTFSPISVLLVILFSKIKSNDALKHNKGQENN